MEEALSTSTAGASTSSSLLSYPAQTTKEESPAPQPVPVERTVVKNRLYVGNLHPSVDEYTLLQVFSKFGKISKLDFLFHKAGPSKGKPRGYAFVEYKEKEDALRALVNAHDKLIRGRKVVVTYANQAPPQEYSGTGPGRPFRRSEVQRPTTLSLLKQHGQSGKTEDKIAALEAKLREMEKTSKPSTLPSHPSLPLKPPPPQSKIPSVSGERSNSNSSAKKQTTASRPGGIIGSRSGPGPGRKPTLEELMKAKKAGPPVGLLKR